MTSPRRRLRRPAGRLRPSRFLALALVGSLFSVLPGLATAPSGAAGWQPNPGATFNIPRDPARELKLEDQVVAAIDHARPGSYIKFSIFSFDRGRVAQALVRAHDRGVHVQVLLNDHRFSGAQRVLRRALGTNRAHKSWSRRCTHGCRSNGDILHSKFYLFSHTGSARYVSMVGSLNMTYNSVHNQYNDLWVSEPNRTVYSWFDDLFQQEAKDVPSYQQHPPHRANENWPAPALAAGRMTNQAAIVSRLTSSPSRGSLLLQAIPWPRYSARNDPIMDLLDKVHCHGATGGTGDAHGRTVVRVSMHTWNGERGAWLARKFRSLYADGCDVRLMYGFAGAATRQVLARPTSRGYVPVRSNGYDTDQDGYLDLYSHQKELMISGHYGSQSKYRLVVTGSSNYNNHGLTGDEILFLIHRHAAFTAYLRNFNYLWTYLTHRVHYQPSSPSSTARTAPSTGEAWRTDPTPATQPSRGGAAWESD